MTTQTNQPTQAEMDAFNERWRTRTESQFATQQKTEKMIEYDKKVYEEIPVQQYTVEQAKKIFWRYVVVAINRPEEEVRKKIQDEKSYLEACMTFVNFIFGFDEKLNEKGGLYICSAPGVGKTTLMLAAINAANVAWKIIKNPGITKWAVMPKDIAAKISGDNTVDLTYAHESNLFLDDMTEKINQVSHYGDYKYSLNEIFQNRYELWKSKGLRTIISSNIISDEMKTNYPGTLQSFIDSRSRDRFREMFHVVELFGKSKRV